MTQELDRILIEGAAEHNLKGIRVEIPKKKLVVLTGVSGSGKSSLAFDTLFAEGQRRYVESLSSYARQFLGQMEKPRYESIRGLTPTIAIDQKAASSNPRSTVGTITEIHDYLRVLFARVGIQHCHGCGRPVAEQSAQQIVEDLRRLPEGTRLMLLAPVVRARKGEHREILDGLRRQGFLRVRVDGEVRLLEEPVALDKKRKHTVEAVVDRIIAGQTEAGRLADSVETALRLGKGILVAAVAGGDEKIYSELNACQYCGISYPELSPQLFSFNSPQGMCKDVQRPGHPLRDGPRKGRARPAAVPGRRRRRALGHRHPQPPRLDLALHREHLPALRHPAGRPAEQAPRPARGPAARQRREDRVPLQGLRQRVPLPVAGGGHPQHAGPPAEGNQVRGRPRVLHEVLLRPDLLGLRRRPPAHRGPPRPDRRARHRGPVADARGAPR